MKIKETLEQFRICPVLDRVLPTTHGHDFDPERFVSPSQRQPAGDSTESSTESAELSWVKDC